MHTFTFKFCKKHFLYILLFMIPALVTAQSDPCSNADFSERNFNGWTGYTSVYPYNTPGTNIGMSGGQYPSPPYYYKEGIVEGRHTLITKSFPDPFTCGNVLTLPPGEKQAVRLGNGGLGPWGSGVEWQRDFLSYDFTITESNYVIVYKYAVVLQDPVTPGMTSHTKELRPRFVVSLKDQQNNPLSTSYPPVEFYADSVQSVHTPCRLSEAEKLGVTVANQGDLRYCDWSTGAFNLHGYVGKTVRVMFETWDCGLSGHFGYAYLTAKCNGQMQIAASSCTPGVPVVLTAPLGFTYKWLPSGETTQSITINNPAIGDTAYVELTSPDGFKSSLKTTLFTTYPTADFTTDSTICKNIPAHFFDKSTGAVYWDWYFGDGVISGSRDQNPVHTYGNSLSYNVRLVAKNMEGCADTIIKTINVCVPAAINSYSQQAVITVYPNPSTGSFKLDASALQTDNVHVQIIDLLGRTIYAERSTTKNGSLQKELEIKAQDGIYFLNIKGGSVNKVIKLVKKD